MDASNVVDWSARPRRTRRPPPPSYWDEYVATDEWYLAKLMEDVPEDEVFAAIEDSDLENDVGEEDDEDEDEEDEEDDDSAIISDTSSELCTDDGCGSSGVQTSEDDSSEEA